jgi:predicted RecA/RadA family phage recombinase
MSLHQLDTLDDVLDLIMELPKEDTRGINMGAVKSLQQMIYYKQMDNKGDYGTTSV